MIQFKYKKTRGKTSMWHNMLTSMESDTLNNFMFLESKTFFKYYVVKLGDEECNKTYNADNTKFRKHFEKELVWEILNT